MDLSLHQSIKVLISLVIALILVGNVSQLNVKKQSHTKIQDMTEATKSAESNIDTIKNSFYR